MSKTPANTELGADSSVQKRTRNHDGGTKTIKGKMYARIQYVDETGKRCEKLKRADNITHARQLIKKMRHELETALQTDKLTFADLVKTYSETKLVPAVIRNGRKISGLRSHANTKAFLKPLSTCFGRKLLRNIKPSDIERYRNERLNSPTKSDLQRAATDNQEVVCTRKTASVNRELELLRAMLYFAKREGWITRNPFEGDKSFIAKTAENERDRVLTFDEEQRILDCFKPRTVNYPRKDKHTGEIKKVTAVYQGTERAHVKALIITALDTAMRRGELFKLKWKNVDFENQTITVLGENTKTEKTRVVGITPRVGAELESLWNKSPKNRNELVFGITNTIKRTWKAILNEAGIEDLTFHDLRHSATTRFVRAGVPHAEIMKITGHSQIKTFLRYLNLSNAAVTSSANLLSAYMNEQQIQIQNAQTSNDLVN